MDWRNRDEIYDKWDELKHEGKVYEHLIQLQGRYIPKLLFRGELVEDLAYAIGTEYSGDSLLEEDDSYLTVNQAKGMMEALSALHEHGIVHGDIRIENFLCNKEEIKIIDFGFSKFKQDCEEDFEELIKKEMEKLKKLIKDYSKIEDLDEPVTTTHQYNTRSNKMIETNKEL